MLMRLMAIVEVGDDRDLEDEMLGLAQCIGESYGHERVVVSPWGAVSENSL